MPTREMGPLKFIIKADSMFSSNDFTIYDNDEVPWLHWEGRNFDNRGGKAALFRSAKTESEDPLLTLDISDVDFSETNRKDKDDHGWFSEGDKKTKLEWTIVRTVQVYSKVNHEGDSKPCGHLKVEVNGIAEAKKDVEYEDGRRTVKWKKKARTQGVKYTMSIEGENVEVSASPGAQYVNMWSFDGHGHGWEWEQTYQCGPFMVRYDSKVGCDEVRIATQGQMNPPIAVALGFALSYWMHPKRVEDDAAELAMAMISNRSGWGW